ncbi:MAG: phosphatase PAP2 family protein [Streptosporangiaceae bacterium]
MLGVARRWAACWAASRPLLYQATRPAVLALALACVIATAAPGVLLAGQTRPGAVDRWADGHLRAWLGGHPHIIALTDLGGPELVAAISVVIVAACLLARRYRAVLLVAVAVPLAGGLADGVLKPLTDRTSNGSLSYPSGHTTAVTAMVVIVIVVLTGPARPPLPAALRWLLSAVLLALVPAEAAALVIAHFHYFTDTIGGAGLGAGVVLLTALALDAAAVRVVARRARPDPAATSASASPGGITEPAGELPRA